MDRIRIPNKTQIKQRSLSSLIKWTVLIFIPVIIAGFCVIAFVYFNNRSQMADNFKKNLDYQTAQLSDNLNRIKYYVLDTLLYNESIKQIKENRDPLKTIYFSNRLIEDLARIQRIVGYDYNFFFFHFPREISLSTPSSRIGYREMKQVNDALLEDIKSDSRSSSEIKRRWNFINLNDSWYIYKYFQYEDMVLGCWIKGSKAFAFINNVTAGDGDFYTVFDHTGAPVVFSDRFHESGVELRNGQTCYYSGSFLVYHGKPKETAFSFAVVSPKIDGFKGIVIVQVILLALVGINILMGVGFMFFIKKDIIEPMQHFYNDISEYNEERRLKKKMGFVELDQAIEKFDVLAQQVRKLKIDIYEEKICRQKTELEYLQLQIKPHFFINCLNMIYGMAESRHYAKIQKLALRISEYLRYYFQNSFEKVPLEDELKHVQGYVDILKIQFGSEFSYESQIEKDIGDYLIPPLVILTMVENSIKHNIFLKSNIKIMVSARLAAAGGKEKIQIIVADNGAGMNPAVLSKLNKGEEIKAPGQRRHIGISNTMRRLAMIYGDQADMRFDHSPEGGCIVTISIPPEKNTADAGNGAMPDELYS